MYNGVRSFKRYTGRSDDEDTITNQDILDFSKYLETNIGKRWVRNIGIGSKKFVEDFVADIIIRSPESQKDPIDYQI